MRLSGLLSRISGDGRAGCLVDAVTAGAVARLRASLTGSPLAGRVRANVPLAGLTSFRVGGPADVFVEAEGPADVHVAVSAALRVGAPYHVIGWGTNLLVRDGGIRGLVVRIGPGMADLQWDVGGRSVVAGAGARLRGLAQAAAELGLRGLEFAEGIPGGLGGAVVMNAGAYDGEIGPLVDWVEVLDLDVARLMQGDSELRLIRIPAAELGYGYRHSSLQGRPGAVVAARLVLPAVDDPGAIRERMDELAARRRERQPLEWPSAGSFFKRPPGGYAGTLIEGCGLKGYRVGGAEVSPKHANFVVNVGGATAADVVAVAEHVRRTVRDRYGVDLQPEVRIIGEEACPC